MVYLFLADGFEECEALVPLDLIKRSGKEIQTVSITDNLFVTGTHGITIKADVSIQEILNRDFEMIILPGGMPGTNHLDQSVLLNQIWGVATEKNRYIAAICAAPLILGKRGLLRGKNATCFPGFEQELQGAILSQEKMVIDGKIITAKGMGVSLSFGLALVSLLCGEQTAITIKQKIQA